MFKTLMSNVCGGVKKGLSMAVRTIDTQTQNSATRTGRSAWSLYKPPWLSKERGHQSRKRGTEGSGSNDIADGWILPSVVKRAEIDDVISPNRNFEVIMGRGSKRREGRGCIGWIITHHKIPRWTVLIIGLAIRHLESRTTERDPTRYKGYLISGQTSRQDAGCILIP